MLYSEEFVTGTSRPMAFATSVIPYVYAIRGLMVREARREAEMKGNTLPEVTMSTVEARVETRT